MSSAHSVRRFAQLLCAAKAIISTIYLRAPHYLGTIALVTACEDKAVLAHSSGDLCGFFRAAGVSVAPEPARISAEALFMSYRTGRSRADRCFAGKRFGVIGTVTEIEGSSQGTTLVRLETGNPFMPVLANVGVERRNFVVRPGDTVTLDCKGVGMRMGSPIVEDCYAAKENASGQFGTSAPSLSSQ